MSETQRRIIEDLNHVNDALREELAEAEYANTEKDKRIEVLENALRSPATKHKVEGLLWQHSIFTAN